MIMMKIERKISEKEIIEKLAELEHEQWKSWAKKKDPEHYLVNVPYSELDESDKEKDRHWARKAIQIIKNC